MECAEEANRGKERNGRVDRDKPSAAARSPKRRTLAILGALIVPAGALGLWHHLIRSGADLTRSDGEPARTVEVEPPKSVHSWGLDGRQELRTVALTQDVQTARLSFASLDEFRDFMKRIVNRTDSSLSDVEKELGFLSMRRAYPSNVDEMVDDAFFATALNPEGQVEIGSYIYEIARHHVYRTLPEDESLLDLVNFDSGPPPATPPGLEVFEVDRHVEQTPALFGRGDGSWAGVVPASYAFGRLRDGVILAGSSGWVDCGNLDSKSWSTNYVLYESAGGNSRYTSKTNLRTSVDVQWTYDGYSVYTSSGSRSCTNKKKCQRVQVWCTPACSFIIGGVSTTSTNTSTGATCSSSY